MISILISELTGYPDVMIQRSIIVETADDVNAIIPGGYSTITD